MRASLAVLTAAFIVTMPTLAHAQDEAEAPGDCPPGSWFCEDEPEEEPVDVPEEPPGDVEDAPEPPTAVVVPTEKGKKPPVIVYQPKGSGPAVIVVDRPDNEPPPPKPRYRQRWGANLRLQGVMMGGSDDGKHPDAGMGGFGFSLRYRPVPAFAFDAGLDFLGGTDYQGRTRRETAFLMSGMVFFNPKDRFQFYTLGGIGFSGATVEQNDSDNFFEDHYSYFGMHLGIGAEYRIGKRVAIGADLVGFIRGRTDEDAVDDYEFVDADTGRTTNTSGGGLFRAGVTFYW